MKNIYCTLDTETIGGAAKPTGTYNIGCVIHDKEGNIYATCSFLIMEHYQKISSDSYAKKNFPLYHERIQNGTISAVSSEHEAVEVIKNLCHSFNVKYVMAYNSAFDFVKTCCRELLNEFEFIDIYLMALQTLTHLKKFQRFCSENRFITASGKCRTTAECLYRFITNNPGFIEEHTALNDALIEAEIFKRCVKTHKRYVKNVHQWDYKGEVKKCFPKALQE